MHERTVLILGAGSSQPYGLPLGWQLRDQVIDFAKREHIHELFEGIENGAGDYLKFAKALATSGEKSVDAFLERSPQWTRVGKLGIAYCLCCVEDATRLFPPNQPKHDHWLETLWGHIRQESWRKQMALPLSIVTFNYDRLVEHYLATVMASTFGVRRRLVNDYVTERLCIHVHGSLGSYNEHTFEELFGGSAKVEALGGAIGIKIIHEEEAVTQEFKRAQSILEKAQRIFFLGFGFHKTNLRRLKVQELCEASRSKLVMGTHKGIKAKAWAAMCHENRFSSCAAQHGAGSVSNFLNEALRLRSFTGVAPSGSRRARASQ
jgi:hypothetical protein